MSAAYTESDDTILVERPGGFEQIPDALWEGGSWDEKEGPEAWRPAVSPAAVVTYMALSKRGGRDDRAVPKRATLGRDMGVQSVRTVDARLDELIEKGWLLVTPRFRREEQGQTSNQYRLLWTPITSADDPRLVEHRRLTAEFDAYMRSRQEANKKEGVRSTRSAEWISPPAQEVAPTPVQNIAPPRAEDCPPPVQDLDTPPAQEPAHLETDLSSTRLLEIQTSTNAPASPAGVADGADVLRPPSAHESDVAQDVGNLAARQWWEAQDPRPAGKGAWHALLNACRAVAERGWTQVQIVYVLNEFGRVPSVAMLDGALRRKAAEAAGRTQQRGGRPPSVTRTSAGLTPQDNRERAALFGQGA